VAQCLLHTNRQAVHDDADCAILVVTFSQYFVEKISQIHANVAAAPQSMTVRHFEVRRHAGPTLVTFSEVTLDEVRRLSKMPSKSSPLDVLPCSLMKSCQDVFAPVITKLANLSLWSGKFPACYNHAQVLLLLKKAGLDTSSPAN